MKKVGIIGCGWLGLEVGKHLAEKDYHVSGTTTSQSKFVLFAENKIEAFHYQLGQPIDSQFFLDLDFLIISIPISTKNAFDDYEALVEQIKNDKDEKTNIVSTSSTSVYHDLDETITEQDYDALNPESINFRFEQLLRIAFKQQLTVIRLGGLISEDRHPVFYLAGRTNIQNGEASVNLVHRNDVVKSIYSIINKNAFGNVYNCVYPYHPTKRNYYTFTALNRNLEPPIYGTESKPGKIVDGSKITRELGVSYQSPI